MRRRHPIFGALVWLAAVCAVLSGNDAASAADNEKVALAIGNGQYVHAHALPNPANDARLIARALDTAGFAVTVAVDADHAAMEKLLRDFVRSAASARIAVLFYAGHGIQVAERNYLVPVDAKLDSMDDVQSATIELDKLLAKLDGPARAKIVLLDSSRDNQLVRGFAQRGTPTRAPPAGLGLARMSGTGTGTLIAFATAPGGAALDGPGANSPFSSSLAKHLAIPDLEVQQLMTRVRAEVAMATGSKQMPWVQSSLPGEVYLAGKAQTQTEPPPP